MPNADADRGQVQHRRDQRERHAAEREAPSSAASAAARSRSRSGSRSALLVDEVQRLGRATADGVLARPRSSSAAGARSLRSGSIARRRPAASDSSYGMAELEHRGACRPRRPGRAPGPSPTKSSVADGRRRPAPASAAATGVLVVGRTPRRPRRAVVPSTGNALVIARERLHLGDVGGQRLEVARVDLHPQRRQREQRDDDARERAARRPGGGCTGASTPTADAAAADPPVQPPQQRDPRPVHPAAELDQQRGQHRDRAEHGDRHDDDRAGGEGVEGRVADDVQAGHRGDDGAAGDEDRVARGLRPRSRPRRGCCGPWPVPRARA